MATSVLARLQGRLLASPLKTLTTSQHRANNTLPEASLTSKSVRGGPKTWKLPAWNYERLGFNSFHILTDTTKDRFDGHSKVVVIEGPMTAGKNALARNFADEFEMMLIPRPTRDVYFHNRYDINLPALNSQIDHYAHFLHYTDMLPNPRDHRLHRVMFEQFMFKLEQTYTALAHLLNTGEGLVMTKPVYSDSVYWEAMAKLDYISRTELRELREVEFISRPTVLRPHLVIYLDLTAAQVMDRIKKRALPEELKSPLLNEEFVSALIDTYKNEWLPAMDSHAEVLVVDASDPLEVEFVIDHVQKLQLDQLDDYESKMADWLLTSHQSIGRIRHWYTNERDCLLKSVICDMVHTPAHMLITNEFNQRTELLSKIAGQIYQLTTPLIGTSPRAR